jgi:peptidoglycan/LPS O-acetylase OafA/YrhL
MAATLAATPSPATLAASGARDASRVDALTGVRALAAGWVVAYHLWLNAGHPSLASPSLHVDLTPLAAMGWLGVDVFFVLSGFVLTWQVLHDPRGDAAFARATFWRDGGSFVRRRMLRVYPAYLATLSVLLPLGWHGVVSPPAGLDDVALHLVMFHNVVPAYVSNINGVYWSMPFEWQFYLVFPLLILPLLARRTAWLLAGGVAVATLAKLISAVAGPGAEIAQLPWRIDEFVVGMAAASLAVRGGLSARAHAVLAWLGVASLIAGSYAVAARDPIWWQPGALPLVRAAWIDATVAMLVIGLCSRASAVARFFALAPVVWLGMISYSVYLWHLPTLLLTREHLAQASPSMPVALALSIAFCAVLAVSALSYYAIEAPFHTPSRAAPALWRLPRTRLAVVVAWGICVLLAALWHSR